jgi:hypothetical protein
LGIFGSTHSLGAWNPVADIGIFPHRLNISSGEEISCSARTH